MAFATTGWILRKLARDTRGAALTEMAFVAPVLISLYLLAYILSDAVICNRKVTVATRELTDVTSRYVGVQVTDLQNVLGAAQQVLVPFVADTAHATIRVSEVQVKNSTQATVIWSCTNATHNSIDTGTIITLPGNMATSTMLPDTTITPARAGAFLIMGEITYNYTPVFSFGGAGAMTFKDRIFLVPRAVNNIPLTGTCPSQTSGD